MDFALIVPAAGSGSRVGRSLPKQFIAVAGRSLLAHAILPFTQVDRCREIVVAVDPAMIDIARESLRDLADARLVEGGDERQDSIASALGHLRSDAGIVLVHDAARPCVTVPLIERLLAETSRVGAAIPAIPVTDTIKQVDEAGSIIATIDRRMLQSAQTPQGFRRELLEEAYANAREQGIVATDDASLVEALGHPVSVVAGDASNIKVTRELDLIIVEQLLGSPERTGISMS